MIDSKQRRPKGKHHEKLDQPGGPLLGKRSSFTFTYGQVEAALATIFGISQAKMAAFRGRIQHLQRLGLPIGIRPGKGKKIDYQHDQACQFLIGLFLEQHGLDPKTITWLVETWWEKELGRWVHRATDAQALYSEKPNPLYLTLQLALMSGTLRTGSRGGQAHEVQYIGYFRRYDEHLKWPDGSPRRRENVLMLLDELEAANAPWDRYAPWTLLVNLTKLVHSFDVAISNVAAQK